VTITVHDCPFCGHTDVEIGEVSISEFAVECNECRCIGPITGDVMSAISAWNNAPRPTKENQ
jgi:Lar family restriction alleviation protein